MWSKIKAYLRKVKAETISILIEAIKQALETITPTNAKNWFKDSGFALK